MAGHHLRIHRRGPCPVLHGQDKKHPVFPEKIMADSKRQQIVSALDTRLKTILTTGGYETNLGNNVKWWRQEPFADTESGISCEDSEAAPEWLGAQCQL